jgi:type IV pilus assembly protein PilC
MPQFEFRGTNRAGQEVSGVRTAPSKDALDAILRFEQVTPSRIVEKGREFAIPKPKVGGKVTSKELAIFTRQFSVMIDAGLPLVQCLEIISTQQENPAFARALTGVRASVEGGSTLANALRQFPKIFDDLYCNMVEAGETGGILDTILQRLSGYIEKAVKLKRAVQSAMIYPIAVIVIAVGVISLLLWKVVPTFATMFASMDVALPLPTRIVMNLSKLVQTFAIPAIVLAVIAFFGFRSYYATPPGRMTIDAIILKMPLLGALMRKIGVARFTRTLGTLITSGVPMLEAMNITARTSGNAVIEKAILDVRKAVETGRTIVDPLRETGVFPNMVVQMIGVGEQTGALDAMLSKIADFYEDEVDAAVGDLLSAMEPMIILVLGVVVGGIVISMYMPIFSMIGQFSQGH